VVAGETLRNGVDYGESNVVAAVTAFRRGPQPTHPRRLGVARCLKCGRHFDSGEARYVYLRYQEARLAQVDAAWRRLVAARGWTIERCDAIATAMGVSKRHAARYRRVLAVLGLIADSPGHFDKHDRDAALPARITLNSKDPDAYVEAVHGSRVYVASRLPAGGYDCEAIARFARDETESAFAVVSKVWWWIEPYEWRSRCIACTGLITTVVTPPVTTSFRGSSYPAGVTNALATERLPLLVLVEDDARTRPHDERSEESPHSRIPPGVVLSAPELVALLGVSRKTVYKKLGRWTDAGLVEQVGRGRYRTTSMVLAQPRDGATAQS